MSSSMEPAASSFASERSVSGQADTAVSLTPSGILKLLVTLRGSCLEDSNPRHLELFKQNVGISVKDLLHLGSAVVNEFQSSTVIADSAALSAFSPNMKPMIVESFSLGISWLITELIKKNSKQSEAMSYQDELNQMVKNEVVTMNEMKFETEVLSDYEEDETETQPLPKFCLTEKDPSFRTKDVPPHILFSQRGVRCKLCWHLFKGTKAVDKLLKHTKETHPLQATASFLEQVRQDNVYEKLIGKGIRYCTCPYCKIFGLARFHDGFWKRPGC